MKYLGARMQVPGHDKLRYLNVHVVDDVMKHDGVIVRNLPITHRKSPDRWRKVMAASCHCLCVTVHAQCCRHAAASNTSWHALTCCSNRELQMDLPLLLKEHERNPADTRTVFYLAQTYELIEDADAALATYQKRIDMGGWQQEVFESHFRRVRALGQRQLLCTACTAIPSMPDMQDPSGFCALSHALFSPAGDHHVTGIPLVMSGSLKRATLSCISLTAAG